jgi:hypothetical protein
MAHRIQSSGPLTNRGLLRASLATALTLALGAAPLVGCGARGQAADTDEGPAATPASAPVAAAPVVAAPRVFAPSRAGCETVPVFEGGAAVGASCVEDLAAQELALVDLSDTWTPRVFAPDPVTQDAPEYRAKYLELAGQPNADLGLYGVAPTLTVLAERLADPRRAACFAGNDRAALLALAGELATSDDRTGAARLRAVSARPAVMAAQGELACAGLLKGKPTGVVTGATQAALEAFRRRHMIVSTGGLESAVAVLSLGGEELDFRALLRGLRERVADAAGLVEDGSAGGDPALVSGRSLDLSRFARPSAEPLPDAAPDLVGAATDAAARALGWTSPEGARAFLGARGKGGLTSLRVAVALPPAPSYHSAAMDLRVEIDRGDGAGRRPSFTVLAKDGERERTLLRWSTTIGGWQKERGEDGEVTLKYKESDVGERQWRRLIAAPAWMPPDSTPEAELLNEAEDGSLALKRDLIQPGYRNAYGLVMLIHDEAITRGAKTQWADHGIRTHGSVSYRSIERGTSHGCHRLYNQLALRLSGFLLQHRASARRGTMHAGYHRTLEWKGQTIEVDVPTRGYLYEIDPPVPVRVLGGKAAPAAPKVVSSVNAVGTGAASKG